MSQSDLNQRLSQIDTLWTMVLQAKAGPQADRSAQQQLMQRYGGAVHRYLVGVTRDANVADDLFQQFALRFVRGDFRRVDPERGRFRNFVKTAVLNLVTDYYRRQRAAPRLISPDSPEPAALAPSNDALDREFLDSWRQELLTRAWEAVKRRQDDSDQPFYTVLLCRAEHPDLRSSELAELLSQELGKPVTANWVRQILFRARKLFADDLLDDVAHSLQSPTWEQVQDELRDLGLLEYCQDALERRANDGPRC